MINAIGNKRYTLAAGEMLDSRWYIQTPKRVVELADLMRIGDRAWPNVVDYGDPGQRFDDAMEKGDCT